MTHTDQILGPDTRARVAWRISSHSTSGDGNCVEAGALPGATGRVAVRHSHHPDGLALVISQPTWTTFIGGVRNDDFTQVHC